MAYIIETPNPFQPLTEMRKHQHPGGISIWGWLKEEYPGFIEFTVPTICLVNGKPTLRKDWDQEIKDRDVVNFIAVTGFIIVLIIVIVLIAVSLALTLSMGSPKTPGQLPGSDPVFSTKGQQNSIRLGEPIEVNYGRNRIYPSLASRPFFRYINNDQFQHSLFCLGQGEYDIEAVQIGDTNIDDYDEVEWEVLPPGSQTTLFATNVYTAPEVGTQIIRGPNEVEYVPPGWIGPFTVCPPGEQVYRIEVDIVYPQGIYKISKKGKIENVGIALEVQARLIDNAGAPLGAFVTILSPIEGRGTSQPQRFTYGADVAAGRYEVQIRRLNNTDPSAQHGDEADWEGLRGFISGNEPDFGNVTLLAVSIRATNNLNAQTQSRFNVIATRKLMIRDPSSGLFYGPVATRSIVWALVDIFRSNYGARISDGSFFDWDALEALESVYEYRDDHFDWTFRDAITVWEAAQTVARAGRAVPLLVGSLISIKRDGPLDAPVTLFTPDNIVQGSFEWNIKLWEPVDFDSIAIEYTDPSTGYLQETVVATLPGGTTDNPQDLRIPGIADRDHAYREGLYILATQLYLRENITFETGLEGYIPTFGDLVAISHDVPRWGQSGYVLQVESLGGGDYQLYVSEPLVFEESNEYQILLRDASSATIGPLLVRATQDSKQVIITLPGGTDFMLGGQSEPMLFLFGVSGEITKYGKVVKVEPQGGERIKITLVNDAPIIHTFDHLTAPAPNTPSLPPVVPDLPTVVNLVLTQIDKTVLTIQAAWTASFGAQYYVVQSSSDGITWNAHGSTARPSIQLAVSPGLLYVRVAAVNNGQGPWTQSSITVSLLFGLAINIPWIGLEWGVDWWEDVNLSYLVKVYDTSESGAIFIRQEIITGVFAYVYDYLKAITDSNLVRDMRVVVDTMELDADGNLVADETPSSIDLHNNIPSPPTTLSASFDSLEEGSGADYAIYKISWVNPMEDDLVTVRIWASYVNGFDPNTMDPVFEETSPGYGLSSMMTDALMPLPLMPPDLIDTWYYRVGLFDIWGNEISTNLSAQQTVTPAWILATGHWDSGGKWIDTSLWID